MALQPKIRRCGWTMLNAMVRSLRYINVKAVDGASTTALILSMLAYNATTEVGKISAYTVKSSNCVYLIVCSSISFL